MKLLRVNIPEPSLQNVIDLHELNGLQQRFCIIIILMLFETETNEHDILLSFVLNQENFTYSSKRR
jgi:hypothetical protein